VRAGQVDEAAAGAFVGGCFVGNESALEEAAALGLCHGAKRDAEDDCDG